MEPVQLAAVLVLPDAPANDAPANVAAPPQNVDAPPAIENEHECVVCLGSPSTCAFVPCGHQCVCEDCARAVSASAIRACPMCRGDIERFVRVFL